MNLHSNNNSSPKYRITYLRSPSGAPVGCVAIQVNKSTNELEYQFSVLNPLDNFNRSVARQLALGRLVEKPFSAKLPKNPNNHSISEVVMKSISSNQFAPTRAVKAARLWLKDQEAFDKLASSSSVITTYNLSPQEGFETKTVIKPISFPKNQVPLNQAETDLMNRCLDKNSLAAQIKRTCT